MANKQQSARKLGGVYICIRVTFLHRLSTGWWCKATWQLPEASKAHIKEALGDTEDIALRK